MTPRNQIAEYDWIIEVLRERDIDLLQEHVAGMAFDCQNTYNEWDRDELRQMQAQLEALQAALKIVLDDHDWITAEEAFMQICNPQTATGQQKGYEDAMRV